MNGDPSAPRAEYLRRITSWSAEIAHAEGRHALMANLRIALAGATAIIWWQAFVSHRLSAWWSLIPLAGFAVVAALHARVIERIERGERARQLYHRGMARLDSTWTGAGPDGGRFLEGRPFARDLDLFGPGSLFQLLDTARTEVGEETLGAWLSSSAAIDELHGRHGAVAELAPRLDFRENLAVLAAESHVGRTSALLQWATAPAAGLSLVHGAIFATCALISATLTVLVLTEQVTSSTLLLWILVQSGIVAVWRARILAALSRVDVADHDLGLMVSLLERIEREPFTAPRLSAIRAALGADRVPPSRRIAALRTLVTWLDTATLNLLFRPVGALLLVRSLMAVAIDRWRATNGPAIGGWLRAVGEMEALSALATYAYEHPGDPFPMFAEEGPVFSASLLGHPLLDERAGVRNDVHLGASHPHALIVSGSNMSGKSTLLRAIGVNTVLAFAGAPVRAASLTLSPLVLGSSMRIEDSLQAGHSRFYAEILRIRDIVDLARGERPLLFLLDEILGGTNSHDRRIGAEAILKALVEKGAIGLMTTHDLALTELAAQLGARVANVHFEDRIENGVMVFDYKMRPGVVQRSNALALMRAAGLDV